MRVMHYTDGCIRAYKQVYNVQYTALMILHLLIFHENVGRIT